MTVDEVHELTSIDPWFLTRIRRITRLADELHATHGEALRPDLLLETKKAGFSDRQIGRLTGRSDEEVRAAREAAGIRPCIKQIDTLAGEYPARTNYLYLTYHGQEDDVSPEGERSVLVLDPGRIGSGARSNSTGAASTPSGPCMSSVTARSC